MSESRWQAVKGRELVAFAAGMALLGFALAKSEPGFVFLLDGANLLFHEAGHPFYGLFWPRIEPYGGTMGQLTFPLILMFSFWRKSNAVGFAAAWVWLFENFLNIARYMEDSRALKLELVGGGHHDWNEIFFRWNVLSYDVEIANGARLAGWVGMGAAVLWLIWRAWRDRNSPREDEMPRFHPEVPKVPRPDI